MVELRFPPGENETAGEKVEELVATPTLAARLVPRVEVLPDRVLLYTDDGDAAAAERAPAAASRPLSVLVRRSTLEDVFLRLTGRTLVD